MGWLYEVNPSHIIASFLGMTESRLKGVLCDFIVYSLLSFYSYSHKVNGGHPFF